MGEYYGGSRRLVKLLKRQSPGLRLVVSFADRGQGHVGTLYQAGGWLFLGQSDQSYFKVRGRVVHPKKSRSDGKHAISLRAVDRIHRQIELQAKLLGELQDGGGPQVNVLIAPEWQEVRVVVLQALAPYPEARAAVAEVLTDARS